MYRSELLARLLRLKQLDNIMVNSETYNVDDDNDDNDDDDDDDNDVDLAVNDSNAFNACHQILSGMDCFSYVRENNSLQNSGVLKPIQVGGQTVVTDTIENAIHVVGQLVDIHSIT